MKRVLLLVVMLLGGCGGVVPASEEGEFLDDMWWWHFGDGERPKVVWMEKLSPRANGEPRDGRGIGWSVVEVARQPGQPLDETALAHEFGHSRLIQGGADVDLEHKGPMFKSDGAVARAESWLREMAKTGQIPESMR